MEQLLLLGSALFCALLWRCLARSMERRAREREVKRRRKSLFLSSLRARSTDQPPPLEPSTFVLERCSSDPQAAAMNIAEKVKVQNRCSSDPTMEAGQRTRKLEQSQSTNNLRRRMGMYERRGGPRLDALEVRRGGGSPYAAAAERSRDYTPGSPGGSPRRGPS